MISVTYLLMSYNKAAYLPSVLTNLVHEQAVTGGEIIIVEDGSTDGSLDICTKFAATSPNVILVRQEKRGLYAALNRAIPIAKGKWLRLCDADDPLIRHSTEYLVEMAAMECADVAYGRAIEYGPAPLPRSKLKVVRSFSCAASMYNDGLLHLVRGVDFSASQAIYRTAKAKQAVPLPESLISCPEFALAVWVAAKGIVVEACEPVCYSLATPQHRKRAVSEALAHHQTIRVLQASGRLLRRRHRNAAISEFYKWTYQKLRGDLQGWKLRAKSARFRALMAAARVGLYDWHSTLDTFAEIYEPELAPMFRSGVKRGHR